MNKRTIYVEKIQVQPDAAGKVSVKWAFLHHPPAITFYEKTSFKLTN